MSENIGLSLALSFRSLKRRMRWPSRVVPSFRSERVTWASATWLPRSLAMRMVRQGRPSRLWMVARSQKATLAAGRENLAKTRPGAGGGAQEADERFEDDDGLGRRRLWG